MQPESDSKVASFSLDGFCFPLPMNSDSTNDDIESLRNHKLRKIVPDPDISVPSDSGQSKSLLPLVKRLRVSDVYSDSDTDSGNEFMNDKTPSKSSRETANVQATASPKNICAGVYMLKQLLCKTGQKYSISLCWVVLSNMDENGGVKVQFMTTVDGKLKYNC
ncbi:hypothetical protein HHI36_002706 [Cryptolaemus montrouzieri]|uniref:Uncharacterized protein n=1 Tax=Cryptolaemus montrouzieri TaxID=559131 RepID=A0ABD2PBT7_9CUCU